MENLNVKKGDYVLVLTGKDAGKKGVVVSTSPKNKKVIVEGVNMQKKHKKARSAQDVGGIIDQAGSIDVSNVQIICPKCDKATRVANVMETIGGKVKKARVCKKCGAMLDKTKEAKEIKKDLKKTAKTAKKAKADKADKA